MSVVAFEQYRQYGRDAKPEQPPTTIATASGYHFVQDQMDALERSLAGESGGVITDKIIVLDVLHPEVPVIDLIDLPGIVTVNVKAESKREAVETIISQQIEADRGTRRSMEPRTLQKERHATARSEGLPFGVCGVC